VGYTALYRRWRPRRFSEVVGQPHVARTLTNALSRGRVAHAYLFCGPRGTGKTSVARILARALNCKDGPTAEPCLGCPACREIDSGSSVDVLEIDAASNRGIDEIRDLRDKVRYSPARCRYKVYIVDEVHMLTVEAFNALLKTLEAPPASVIFVLATTEPHKLPPTILSRCQRFDFHRLSIRDIATRLGHVCENEGFLVSDEALGSIARHADGSMRDALSLLEQTVSYAGDGEVIPATVAEVLGAADREALSELTRAVSKRDAGAALVTLNRLIEAGRDAAQIARDWSAHLRALIMVKVGAGEEGLVGDELARLSDQAAWLSLESLTRVARMLAEVDSEMRWATQPRLLLELAAVRACRPDADASLEGLAERVASLERRAGGAESGLPPRAPSEIAEETREASKGGRGPGEECRGHVDGVAQSGGQARSRRGRPRAATTGACSAGVSQRAREGPPLSIKEVRDRWPEVVRSASRYKPLVALLERCFPHRVDGRTVVLGVANGFYADSLSNGKKRSELERALREVLGRDDLVVKCEETRDVRESRDRVDRPPAEGDDGSDDGPGDDRDAPSPDAEAQRALVEELFDGTMEVSE